MSGTRDDSTVRWRDLLPSRLEWRAALRLARREPLVSVTVIVALATGIALAAAAFTFFAAVAAGELPYPNGDRFVRVRAFTPDGERTGVELERYRLLRAAADRFAYLGTIHADRFNLLLPGGDVDSVAGAELTPGWFRHLPAAPVAGRLLGPDDGRPGATPVAVLRESLWRRLFGADPATIGSTLRVSGVDRIVVGVAPDDFGFPSSGELWLSTEELAPAGSELQLAGVLADDAELEAAAGQIETLSARFDAEGGSAQPLVLATSLLTDLSGSGFEVALGLLVAMLLLVLLLIASNVANLIFARSAARGGELALRAALGASRGRLVRQLVAEVLLLGGAAALLGLGGSSLLLGWVERSIDADELPFWIDLSPDLATALFVALITAFAAAVAGALPALRATRGLALAMKSGARAGDRLSRANAFWVVTEMALSVALVTCALAIARGTALASASGADLPRSSVATAQIYLAPEASPDTASSRAADDRIAAKRATILEAVRRVPGVVAAGATSTLPFRSAPLERIALEPAPGEPSPPARATPVAEISAGFLEALAARPLAGRLFTPADFGPGAAPVAIVNLPFVERELAGRSALGVRIRLELPGDAAPVWREIVGVVPDLALSVGDPALAGGVYLPLEAPGLFFLAVRGGAEASALLQPLRRALFDLDPSLAVRRVEPLGAVGREDRSAMAAMSGLLSGVGLVALLLSLLGIYALVSYRVTRRTREIGVRLALGARPGQIVRLVLGGVTVLFASGAVAGSLLASGLLSIRASILVERFPDPGPWIFPLVVVALGAAGVAACGAPLKRALAIDPARALSSD